MISKMEGRSRHGGYVLIGTRLEVPVELSDARFSLEYRMSFVEREWRGLRGHLGLAVMTEAAWNRLARKPDQAGKLDFYRNDEWIYHVKLDGYNSSAVEFVSIESPDFSSALQAHRGQTLYFALIWGTVQAGADWCEFRNLSCSFKNMEESTAGFLNAFRTDIPGLENMHAARQAGDLPAAKSALVRYFRERSGRIYLKDPDSNTPQSLAYAEKACQGEFFAPGSHVPPVAVERERMWSAMPQDQEQWAVAINRHSLWPWLAAAYRQTGDRAFLEEAEWQIMNWSRAMPIQFGRFFTEGLYDEFGKLPLTLNAGLRMGQSWFTTLDTLKGELSDEALYTLLYWMREHGRYLSQSVHFSPDSNWGAMQNNGLFHAAVMLPELREAEQWQHVAQERMVYTLARQIYPDGVQKELTPSYHRATASLFASSIRLARLNHIPLSAEVDLTINRMYRALAGIMMPDFRSPDINDSIRVSAADLSVAVELFPDDDFFDFFASERARGSAPDFTSIEYPWAGWRMMRENWEPDGICLFFDSGPLGLAHYHEDKLGFLLFARGEPLIREFGFYPYDQSEWSLHSRSARAHNTVLIDGCGQSREASHPKYLQVESPEDNGVWFSDPHFDYAKGEYEDGIFADASGNKRRMTHQREIVFLKPDSFLIVDTLTPPDTVEYTAETLFHLSKGDTRADSTTGIVISRPGRAQLRIIPLTSNGEVRIVEGQREPFLLGWQRTSTVGNLDPRPVAVYRSRISGPTRMAWLLLPETASQDSGPVPVSVINSASGEGLSWVLPNGKPCRVIFEENEQRMTIHLENTGPRQEALRLTVSKKGSVEVSDDSKGQ